MTMKTEAMKNGACLEPAGLCPRCSKRRRRLGQRRCSLCLMEGLLDRIEGAGFDAGDFLAALGAIHAGRQAARRVIAPRRGCCGVSVFSRCVPGCAGEAGKGGVA